MYERDRQTDKLTSDHGTVTSIPISEITFSDVDQSSIVSIVLV